MKDRHETDLDNADSPEDVPQILRNAAQGYRESVSELQAAWQDPGAGVDWEPIAKKLDQLADSIDNHKLEIRSFLVLSTAHLPEKTAQMLDEVQWGSPESERDADRPPTCGGTYGGYGWFMYVQDEGHDETDAEFPGLGQVFAFANKLGFSYVLFDRDAETVDGLPTYDW